MGISRASTSVRKIGKTKIINRVNSNGHRSETRVTAVNTAGSTKTYDRVTTTADRPKLKPLSNSHSKPRTISNNSSNEMSTETSMAFLYLILAIVFLPFFLIYWAWDKYRD